MRAALSAALLLLVAPARAADDPSAAGAYCPFPEPGQKPVCLTDVQEKYPAFMGGADSGVLDELATAAVEADLASATTTHDAYLALSSLAYAYYRLAQFEAANPGADPALVSRLQHWNGVMSNVYHDASADPRFREAVYEAASDLHARVPAVHADCDPSTEGEDCRTTNGLMSALRSADDFSQRQGVRGALSRILGRMLGSRESTDAP